jgi:hypothetical protein
VYFSLQESLRPLRLSNPTQLFEDSLVLDDTSQVKTL